MCNPRITALSGNGSRAENKLYILWYGKITGTLIFNFAVGLIQTPVLSYLSFVKTACRYRMFKDTEVHFQIKSVNVMTNFLFTLFLAIWVCLNSHELALLLRTTKWRYHCAYTIILID